MKSVLISIRPEWCEKIASGRKTIEVRKNRPKIPTPFKCYIYCTKPTFAHEDFLVFDAGTEKVKAFYGGGKVIGEFVCDEIIIDMRGEHADVFEQAGCIPLADQKKYAPKQKLFGWHISDLVIYDKPKQISDFQLACNHKEDCFTCKRFDRKHYNCIAGIRRPPQSWCYVEEVRNNA